MEFAWTDDLARLLDEEDGEERRDLSAWLSRPVAYRLPEDESVLKFARELFEREHA